MTVKSMEYQNNLQKQLSDHLTVRGNLTDRLELLTKQYSEANANKESMVIKYAMAEKNVLVAQKQRDALDKRNKELEKDKDVLLARVKNISSEKTRFSQILDKKVGTLNMTSKTYFYCGQYIFSQHPSTFVFLKHIQVFSPQHLQHGNDELSFPC